VVRVPYSASWGRFVRLISFKLKEANMILSEYCGGMQPGDHCLVISVKSIRSSNIMVLFFAFSFFFFFFCLVLFFKLRKLELISL